MACSWFPLRMTILFLLRMLFWQCLWELMSYSSSQYQYHPNFHHQSSIPTCFYQHQELTLCLSISLRVWKAPNKLYLCILIVLYPLRFLLIVACHVFWCFSAHSCYIFHALQGENIFSQVCLFIHMSALDVL